MKKIYLAGAYSADNVMDVLHNIGIGIKMATKILKEGNAPFCPWLDYHFAMEDQTIPKENFYKYSLAWLEVSDEIWVIPDWKDSKGTIKELDRALELNIPIKFL
jgi:hypothetical protein